MVNHRTNPNYRNGLILNSRGNAVADHVHISQQRKIASLIEAISNAAAGILVATGAQVIIFPWFGIIISWADTWSIAILMTGVSIVRSYVLRRVFEWLRVTRILP